MKIKQRTIAICSLVIILLISCRIGQPLTPTTPTTGISGTILRSDTGAVIPNAQISLYAENMNSPIMKSDKQGHFSSFDLKPGTYSIQTIEVSDAKSQLPCFSPVSLMNSKGPLTVISTTNDDGSGLLAITGLEVTINDGQITQMNIDLYEICGVFRP